MSEQQGLMRQAEPPKPMTVFAREMKAIGPKLIKASGGKVDPERMGQLVVFTVGRTPTLAAAVLTPNGRNSLLNATMDAATLGLMPTGKYGGGYLLPFRREKGTPREWTEVVFVPDYRALARAVEKDLGPGWRLRAEIVCENDNFDIQPGGLHPKLEHTFDVNAGPSDRGNLVGAYVVATPPDGSPPIWRYASAWEIMTKHESRSRGADKPDSPWQTDRDTMFKKTVTRIFASEAMDASENTIRFLAAADRETDHGDTAEAAALMASADALDVTADTEPVKAPATATDALKAKLSWNVTQGQNAVDIGAAPADQAATRNGPTAEAEKPAPAPKPAEVEKRNPGKRLLTGVPCPGCRSKSNVWEAWRTSDKGDTICANSDHGEPIRFVRPGHAEEPMREPGEDRDEAPALPAGGMAGTLTGEDG